MITLTEKQFNDIVTIIAKKGQTASYKSSSECIRV